MPGHKDQAVDGRAPGGIERHHPIHRSERDRQGVQHQSDATQPLEARPRARKRTGLACHPRLFSTICEPNPDGEIDQPADDPPTGVFRYQWFRSVSAGFVIQAYRLVRQERIGRNSTNISGSHLLAALQDPADDQSPQTAGQILHHQQREAAEAQAQSRTCRRSDSRA